MQQQHLILNAILGGLTLLLAVNPAIAGEGFSIGASAVRANVDIKDVGIDIDGETTGYRFFGTYMFTERFGIEAGYSAFGKPNDITIPSNLSVETDSYDVFAVASYPMSANFALIGKAGFAASQTETEVNDENETHHKSTDFALSLGGNFDFTERFAVRGELQWIDNNDAGAANMITLGGVYRFK